MEIVMMQGGKLFFNDRQDNERKAIKLQYYGSGIEALALFLVFLILKTYVYIVRGSL